MKKYLIILLFLFPVVSNSQLVLEKFGSDSTRMGVFLIKTSQGDTLIISIDTVGVMSIRPFTTRLIDSIVATLNLKRTYIVDPSAPVIDSLDGANEIIYLPLYPTVDQWRVDGWVSYANLASDSILVKWNFNFTALQIPGNAQLHLIMIHTQETGISPQILAVIQPPAIASPDSMILGIKLVTSGGTHHISMNKYYVPGLASNFSPPLTGGTNMLYTQISSALFPTPGTSVVQIRVTLWFIFRRF